MRAELSFLAIAHTNEMESALRAILAEFEQINKVTVHLELSTWDTAWKDFVKYGLYHGGPDVSEMPSTWVSDFVAMSGLRPYKPAEIASFGDTSAFLEPAWKSCMQSDGSSVWAIPWITDTRVLYYRKDLLEKAGIAGETAFTTTQNMETTLRRLHESGVRVPWIVQTVFPNVNTLHNLATWIWSAGGDFVDPASRKIKFTEPEALNGMRAFFSLHRYIAPEVSNMDYAQAEAMFWIGEAAVVMAGPNLIVGQHPEMAPVVRANLGAAMPPGVPFVGGSHLSVWNHTPHPQEALALVRYLVSPAVQRRLDFTTLLPARTEAYYSSEVSRHPLAPVLLDGLKKGHSYPFFSMWGMLEDRLVPVLSSIWRDVLNDRGSDINLILTRHLDPLVRKLQLTFRT